MSTIPGLFVLGEANFSDHGANRLGASALMQGLADGYFVIPYTLGGYIAGSSFSDVNASHQAFKDSVKTQTEKITKLLSINGKRTVDDFHKQLGHVLWDNCGMARNDADMQKAIKMIPEIRDEFRQNVTVPGSAGDLNQSLERANRVADFLEFGELIVKDALSRRESCGCHFNVDYQTEEHEAKRDDENCSYVSAWEYNGEGKEPTLHKEPLEFENVELTQRSYK